MHTGDNDKHEFLHELLDRKKRSHKNLIPESDDSSNKKQRVSSASCANVEVQSEGAEAVAFCKRQNSVPHVSPCIEDRPEGADSNHFPKQLFVEVFCGTGGLTANIKALGFQGIGIDSSVSTSCKSPVLKLDLTKPTGQQILWEVLKRPNICGVHLAPPCGTASRARDIPGLRGQARCHLGQNLSPMGSHL